jgi:hypothetical protein
VAPPQVDGQTGAERQPGPSTGLSKECPRRQQQEPLFARSRQQLMRHAGVEERVASSGRNGPDVNAHNNNSAVAHARERGEMIPSGCNLLFSIPARGELHMGGLRLVWAYTTRSTTVSK